MLATSATICCDNDGRQTDANLPMVNLIKQSGIYDATSSMQCIPHEVSTHGSDKFSNSHQWQNELRNAVLIQLSECLSWCGVTSHK